VSRVSIKVIINQFLLLVNIYFASVAYSTGGPRLFLLTIRIALILQFLIID
jgi:hypothetical protein